MNNFTSQNTPTPVIINITDEKGDPYLGASAVLTPEKTKEDTMQSRRASSDWMKRFIEPEISKEYTAQISGLSVDFGNVSPGNYILSIPACSKVTEAVTVYEYGINLSSIKLERTTIDDKFVDNVSSEINSTSEIKLNITDEQGYPYFGALVVLTSNSGQKYSTRILGLAVDFGNVPFGKYILSIPAYSKDKKTVTVDEYGINLRSIKLKRAKVDLSEHKIIIKDKDGNIVTDKDLIRDGDANSPDFRSCDVYHIYYGYDDEYDDEDDDIYDEEEDVKGDYFSFLKYCDGYWVLENVDTIVPCGTYRISIEFESGIAHCMGLSVNLETDLPGNVCVDKHFDKYIESTDNEFFDETYFLLRIKLNGNDVAEDDVDYLMLGGILYENCDDIYSGGFDFSEIHRGTQQFILKMKNEDFERRGSVEVGDAGYANIEIV